MKPKLRNILIVAGVAAAYFDAARVAFFLPAGNPRMAPVWPVAGLGLAAVLVLGYRAWPGVALGAFLGTITGPAGPGGREALAWASAGVALGSALEAVTGAWLVQKFARGRAAFEQPYTVFLFVALGAIVSTLIGPALGVPALSLAGALKGQNQSGYWFDWWLGDMVSVVVIAPLLVVWSAKSPLRLKGGRIVEVVALLLLLVLVCQVLFGGWFAGKVGATPLAFLLIPILLWPALRFGQRGTTATLFILSCLAVLGTVRGAGPFAVQNWTTSLLLLQEFVGVAGVMALVLAADVAQRLRADEQLRASEQRFRHFSSLGQHLSAARTAREAAQIIAGTADTLFGWDSFVLDLYSPDGESVEMAFCIDVVDGRRVEVEPCIGLRRGPTMKRFMEQGAQIILRQPPFAFAAETHPFGDNTRPSASLMYVPVRMEERVIGVLSIQSYTADAYTERDLRALQALADHCGGALERIRAEAALVESDQRLQMALAVSKMGVWTYELGEQGRIYGSPQLVAIFGLKPGEFAGTREALFKLIHPDDHARVREAIEDAIRNPVEKEIEFRILPHGRKPGWLLVRGRAWLDAQNKPVRLAGVGIDITARKAAEEEILRLNAELERRVGERTAQLQAINKELEAFSYSVSHDLRAPLRSIRGFSEILLERYHNQLDQRGQEFLRRACESCNHMDMLIEDLLNLSRLGRSEMRRQAVDLSALAGSIITELRKAEPERRVEIIIAPGLTAEGDERLLRVVLDNLLRNAWKFTQKQTHARVEFGALADPEPAFFVRDNGAGFDMTYAGKLFGVFQRLHSASDYPGVGVGLATVQRIINRHGGRVWAQGAVNQGATFYFTLPSFAGGETVR